MFPQSSVCQLHAASGTYRVPLFTVFPINCWLDLEACSDPVQLSYLFTFFARAPHLGGIPQTLPLCNVFPPPLLSPCICFEVNLRVICSSFPLIFEVVLYLPGQRATTHRTVSLSLDGALFPPSIECCPPSKVQWSAGHCTPCSPQWFPPAPHREAAFLVNSCLYSHSIYPILACSWHLSVGNEAVSSGLFI